MKEGLIIFLSCEYNFLNLMSKRGVLVILSGPSGVGKGTVRKILMELPGVNLFYSISLTTRPKRPGEEEGKDYYFVDKETFQKNIDDGNLLEYAEFVGNYYGTPKDKVEEMLNEGKNVLLEIEVNGTKKVLAKMPDAVSIYLMPPNFGALESRIRGRSTEEEAIIQKRLAKARMEMELAGDYEYNVVNDDVNRAANEIARIIRERSA